MWKENVNRENPNIHRENIKLHTVRLGEKERESPQNEIQLFLPLSKKKKQKNI